MFGSGGRFMTWRSGPVILSLLDVEGNAALSGLPIRVLGGAPISLQRFGQLCNILAPVKMRQSIGMRKTPFAL